MKAMPKSQTSIREQEVKVMNHPIFEGVKEYDLNYQRGVKGFFNRRYFERILSDSDKQYVGYTDRISTNSTILAKAGADLP